MKLHKTFLLIQYYMHVLWSVEYDIGDFIDGTNDITYHRWSKRYSILYGLEHWIK
jgi:hypothetical protein